MKIKVIIGQKSRAKDVGQCHRTMDSLCHLLLHASCALTTILHAAPFHHLCRWLEGGSGRQQQRIDTLSVFSEAHLQEELHRSARTLQDSETASLNSFYTSYRALFVPIEYHHFRFQKTQEALGSWDSGTLGPTLSATHSIWGANARSCALAMVRAILAKELTHNYEREKSEVFAQKKDPNRPSAVSYVHWHMLIGEGSFLSSKYRRKQEKTSRIILHMIALIHCFVPKSAIKEDLKRQFCD